MRGTRVPGGGAPFPVCTPFAVNLLRRFLTETGENFITVYVMPPPGRRKEVFYGKHG